MSYKLAGVIWNDDGTLKCLTPSEALEKLTNYKCSCLSEKVKCREIIENTLKALEIIKEKGLTKLHMSLILSSKDYEEYSWEFDFNKKNRFGLEEDTKMIKEEFDLLKEVLL